MPARLRVFEKLVKILPRSNLEILARDCCGNNRPWQASRAFLETQIISHEDAALRQRLLAVVGELVNSSDRW